MSLITSIITVTILKILTWKFSPQRVIVPGSRAQLGRCYFMTLF